MIDDSIKRYILKVEPTGSYYICNPPEKYIISNDSIQSYRNYYKFEKRHLFGWRKRSIPDFIL